MKSVLALTLVVCLVGSTLPAGAQELPRSDRIGRSITREAVRLAAAPQNQSADAGWSLVRKLTPETKLVLAVRNSPPESRYFVRADESELMVLNVTDPALPAVVTNTLRDVASHHPDYFLAAQRGGQFVFARQVRMSRDGVFVADRKVAELAQVIETIARDDVVEISGPAPYPAGHEALVGLGIGAATGAGISLLLCHSVGGCGSALILGPAALFGGMFAGISLVPGGYKARHRPLAVIYRAP